MSAATNDHVFDIHEDGVTINGFTVTGATDYAGINLECMQHCNISDNNCTRNYQGIYAYYSDNNTIADNAADSNRGYGIRFYYSDNNRVINNSASFNEGYFGIRVYRSDGNALINNSANHNNWEGIRLYYSNDTVVDGNNASYNGGDTEFEGHGIVSWRANNTTIQNNILMHNDYQGIYIYNASNNTAISNNEASHNVYHGIYTVQSSSNMSITGNKLVDNGIGDNWGYGIYLRDGRGAIVSDNYIADNAAFTYAYGIKVRSFANATIHNNTIINNSDYGILIDSSSARFTGAAMAGAGMISDGGDEGTAPLVVSMIPDEGCDPGVVSRLDMDTPAGINVTENRVMDNVGGIWLSTSSGVMVAGNTVTDNDVGINLTSSGNNTIYNNYLADNIGNAHDSGTGNIWNTTPTTGPNIIGGPEIGGNYWSDYAGTDTDGDGFGEAAHDIPGGSNHDYLPLVPWCGNLDGNMTVDAADLQLLLAHIFAGTSVADERVCDVDGSGHVNILDARLLMNHLDDPAEYPLNCTG